MKHKDQLPKWTMLKKSIVIAYLDLETCEVALDAAQAMLAPGGTIHLAHAVAPYASAFPGMGLDQNLLQDLESTNRAKLQREFASMDQERFELHVSMGDPVSVVHEIVSEVQAELLVVASHNRSGVARWLYGSVAEHLIRDAPCPVLVLNSQDEHTYDGSNAIPAS